jgi:DNA-directed RNA polymerase specialized sigma subunit
MPVQENNVKEQTWQDNQNKKDYLNGYLAAKRKEKMTLDQIQQLRLNEMCPSVKYDDMPHGSNITDMSGYAVKMDELMEELERDRLNAIEKYTEIYHKIKLVEDEREQEILTYRYLLGESWEIICGIMGLSWRRIHQIHAKSLKNFKIA